jgi:hypothetical protein
MTSKRVLFKLPQQAWQPGRVVLNWSGDPIVDLERVARRYASLAHDRVKTLESKERPITGGDEFEAYPIVFLYRQAFELTLKAIVFAGAVFLRDIGEEPLGMRQVMKHDLMPLFEEVDRIFNAIVPGGSPWDFDMPELKTRSDFQQIVREFDCYDRGSYTFRYPVKKDGTTASLDRGFEFDLFAFAALMDRILPALEGAPEWIRDLMQGRWEAAYEAQQEAWANADYEPPDYDYDPPDYEPPDYDYDPPDYDPPDYDPS